MEQSKQTRSPRERTEEQVQPGLSAGGGGTLLAEAAGWGKVAADALAQTQSVAGAERELERRHNTSGE